MQDKGVKFKPSTAVGTIVYLAVDGKYIGCIVIEDEIKDDAPVAIKQLKASGISKTVMLTGDSDAAGKKVAIRLGLDQTYTELLPVNKVDKVEVLLNEKSAKGTLVFVGDGINDAPVLARADVGIAMGGLGSDAAIEAAVFADVGVSVIAILNAIRAMSVKEFNTAIV